MKTRALWLAVCALLGVETGECAVGTWRNFTSMKEVRSVASEGTSIWAASGGGLFKWNIGENSFERFTSADGLKSIDLTSVGVDNQGNIWTGTSTGVIHVYSQGQRSWQYILDIANKREESDKRINGITIIGDTAFVCTNFGVSLVNTRNFQFRDTFRQFGSLSGSVKVAVYSALVFNDSLWLAVSDRSNTSRVAVAGLAGGNLQFPQAWDLRIVGATNVIPRSLIPFNNNLYAATSAGLFAYGGGTWSAVSGMSGLNIVGVTTSATLLYVTTSSQVFSLDTQGNVQLVGSPLPFAATALVAAAQGRVVVGTTGGGVVTSDSSWTSHFPDGPNSNQFLSVAVDADSRVWAASGYNGGGKGIYRYNGKNWKSFTTENSPIPTNDYYRVSIGCDGSAWASSYGRGMVEIPRGEDDISPSRIYRSNVGLIGIPIDTSFIVPATVVCDGQGTTMFNVVDPADKRVIIQRRGDGTWAKFPAIENGTSLQLLQDLPIDRCFAIDTYGNLWSAVKQAGFQGVITMGNRGALNDTIVAFHLTTNDGLPDNNIRTIVADRDGQIWVGTERGIGIILDPLNPKRPGGVASYVVLRNETINCIAVDALNQKWIGTPKGVFVYSPDGTQPIDSYDVVTTDGKLIDNDVKSIAIDGNTGTVYFGTLYGLASITTVAVAPKLSFESLTVAPNPFFLPNTSDVVIDGLVESSTLKILTIDGTLVREIKSPGGRIGFWDGKDESGNLVASGIYVVVASSEKDTKVATGKIAVIRR